MLSPVVACPTPSLHARSPAANRWSLRCARCWPAARLASPSSQTAPQSGCRRAFCARWGARSTSQRRLTCRCRFSAVGRWTTATAPPRKAPLGCHRAAATASGRAAQPLLRHPRHSRHPSGRDAHRMAAAQAAAVRMTAARTAGLAQGRRDSYSPAAVPRSLHLRASARHCSRTLRMVPRLPSRRGRRCQA